MDKSVLQAILAIAAFAVSLVLATVGFGLGIPTPGMWVATFLASRANYTSMAAAVALPLAIDFVFWLSLICLLYWLFRGRPKREKLG